MLEFWKRKQANKQTTEDNSVKIKPPVQVPEGNTLKQAPGAVISGPVRIAEGTGNRITLWHKADFKGSITIHGSDNTVMLGAGSRFRGSIRVVGNGQKVIFGEQSTANDVYILCDEGENVIIGRHCMFSRKIEIRTTDSHSIVSLETGERVNKPASILIGDHVWVGLGAVINKGAQIADDNVIGAMAFVSGTFEESGTIIAGVPAKVVRRGVTWHRARRDSYDPEELNRWRR